ncbi:SWIM zinc finger family protein [Actinomadura parmotrematis]|uniref:SWIM zinc finger domain-containing protein n=1 Tax=Actinomadura parmotrematis TaxID=2864039 RepID=A0ABS7FYA0_9ACTN|nr:SWIM zinc finger family protein [Actinomadura parmotrematis]MBW8485413.1 SWIM zinc finger domain-containing protein [Actinomadura parmotrematis]
MSDRWDREHVLGLAPDAASAKAGTGVAKPAKWSGLGCGAGAVWGECQGSGKSAYRAAADLGEPAFRCSCPSRKFPCKHVLGLLLLWSDGAAAAGEPPAWVAGWLAERAERAGRAQARKAVTAARARDPKTAAAREEQVAAGVADLDRWLADQVAHGLAQAEKAPYRLWDDAARRLVDAKAGALAGQVRALASVPRRPGWPGLLLEEYALLRLLVRAHAAEGLSAPLRETVRARIGFTVVQEDVLASGERVRDRWCVVGSRDLAQEQLTTRRVWLRSRSGRSALVLSFAAPGRPLDVSLAVGTEIDAELAFYPGARPLRALVAERHGPAVAAVPDGTGVAALLDEFAAAVAADPWLDRWPAVLAGVRLARDGAGLWAVDAAGAAVPLRTGDPWRLLAVAGGDAVTVAGEWSGRRLRALAGWHPEEGVVIL